MHRTQKELEAARAWVATSPRNAGTLDAIVVRPSVDARQELKVCRLDVQRGAIGDRWESKFSAPPEPGSPELDSQLTLMNARVAELLAGTRERWALAGDQLFVDFDLSEDHLRPGNRVQVGNVVLEVTAKAHNGCRKFAARYGEAALAWVNSPDGKRLHLRGIYARVVTAGEVRVGDRLCRMQDGPDRS